MNYVQLGPLDLGIALVLIGVSIVLTRLERVGYTSQFLVGTVRTIVQLLAMGFLLKGVFHVDAWWVNLLVLLAMVAFATHNAVRRQDVKTEGYAKIAALALLTGPFATLSIVLFLVIRATPRFDAQYVIPLGGMIIAYAMNTLTLYKNRFDAEFKARRGEVKAKLALGATTRRAAEEVVRQAWRAALLPTLNHMMVVGIVQIPGMMGGQIIGGVDPLFASLYQILVAFQLAASGVISCFVVSRLTFRKAFTADHRIT